ncbi:21058_t:CDS:2 [Cetraspora pellucida]|uniref:21058_t:CDS:1 n=1 Tax=Cetraspora pellucida TaxID=1433469 RepID=A0A9N8Z7Z0_9GLOM|nr:21058_t:CDS:2 [Cetraspora pellucida]
MIATSHVESVNTCLKHLIYNSNTSLCELATEIHKLLNIQDKENDSQEYSANSLQAMLKQMIKFVELDNIEELWTINVSNSLKSKHYVILLQNRSHLCSCLSIIHHSIVCRHYFQVMLVTSKTNFHIHLLSSQWFCTSENGIEELFLVADKFYQETQNQTSCFFSVQYLSVLEKDSIEENLIVLEQKVTYRKIHKTYKKALCKVLQTYSKSEKLISLLEKFVNDSNESNLEDHESITDADNSDKENNKINNFIAFCIKNSKVCHGKG